jgi:hypothetical protein
MDDLANNWGVNLCYPENSRPSILSPWRSLPRSQSAGDRPSFAQIPGLVAAETDDFVFERVAVSGSQANNWAINDATQQNANRCLFGAGSYVAGDGSALQSFSTSDFSPCCELALIMAPNEVKIPIGRSNTVPLPYHIPGVLEPNELIEYEDECLQALHIRLCWGKMRREPYKAILLELILAGNGASLSNRALICLAKLAIYHQLRVIVDEIMTGGRTGEMFCLLSKPPSFRAVVTHVTFGKFTKLGMIFISKSWLEERTKMYPFTQRGASTSLGADQAVVHWRCVKKNLSDIPKKREKVLKKLKLKEEQVWGAGLLMFGPCRWDTPSSLKCRYLPLIHEHTPFDSSAASRRMMMPRNDFRVHVNGLIIQSVNEWIDEVPQPEDDLHSSPAEQKIDAERLLDFSFISQVIAQCDESEEKGAEDWIKEFMPADVNRHNGEAALARLERAGGFQKTQVGKKRKRCWKLTEGFVAPWKVQDFDDVVDGMLD